jgi:predicted nucleotidyltransferase
MAELYTSERRAEILENLLTFFQTDEQIVGLVLVGSGAVGFRDAYSDINLLVVADNEIPVYALFHKWNTRLNALYPRLTAFEQVNSNEAYHIRCLLENYLALDLQFIKLRRLSAYNQPWQVVVDRTGEMLERLEKTYAEELTTAPIREYTRIMETVWMPILKCVAALRRNEIWRALYLLEELRKQAVELAGMNHGLDTRGFTAVDRLPEMFLVHLRHTIPTSTSTPAVRRALRTTVVLLFGEISTLEDRLSLPRASALRQRILTYIEAYS